MIRDELSLRNHFAGLVLDRAEEVRHSPEALAKHWPKANVLVVDFEGKARGDDAAPFFLLGESLTAADFAAASFLGLDNQNQAYFALLADDLISHSQESAMAWIDLRRAAALWSRFHSGLYAYAKALLLWQTRARFCGVCGSATQLIRAGHCAQCSNADCKMQQFPRTDAAIIVLVSDGRRALLGRQSGWPEKRWSTLAGFVEPGESLEDAVRREVNEEAGVAVGEVVYHSSQPWPFPGALMVGFHATANNPQIHVGDELEDARWFDVEGLVSAILSDEIRLPPPISISRRLILDWLAKHVETTVLVQLEAVN